MTVISAEQRAEALRAARGERRPSYGLPCGIRFLSSTPEPALAASEPVSAEQPDPVVTTPRMIRTWAADHGVPCPARGRIPSQVRTAYANAVWYRTHRQGVSA